MAETPPNDKPFVVDASPCNGTAARVLRGAGVVCTVWRPLMTQANADAQAIVNLLNVAASAAKYREAEAWAQQLDDDGAELVQYEEAGVAIAIASAELDTALARCGDQRARDRLEPRELQEVQDA